MSRWMKRLSAVNKDMNQEQPAIGADFGRRPPSTVPTPGGSINTNPGSLPERCHICGRRGEHCEKCHRSAEHVWNDWGTMPQPWVVDREKLRAVRLGLGLTQKVIAERLRVSEKTMSTWERGISAPTPEIQYAWENLLEDLLSAYDLK